MKTITRKSLADEIATRLQEQVSLGHYKANEKLPIEAELMKQFGVGRSTVREAIKILANSGILRVRQGVGTFVEQVLESREPMTQRLKRASASDLYEVRQLLEMKIAENAAVHRSEKDIITLKNLLEARNDAAQAGLLSTCIDADIQFHVSIAEACNNEILAELYKSTSIHLKKWFFDIYSDTQKFIKTQGLHEKLLKYIIAGNPKKAWHMAAKITGHVSQ